MRIRGPEFRSLRLWRFGEIPEIWFWEFWSVKFPHQISPARKIESDLLHKVPEQRTIWDSPWFYSKDFQFSEELGKLCRLQILFRRRPPPEAEASGQVDQNDTDDQNWTGQVDNSCPIRALAAPPGLMKARTQPESEPLGLRLQKSKDLETIRNLKISIMFYLSARIFFHDRLLFSISKNFRMASAQGVAQRIPYGGYFNPTEMLRLVSVFFFKHILVFSVTFAMCQFLDPLGFLKQLAKNFQQSIGPKWCEGAPPVQPHPATSPPTKLAAPVGCWDDTSGAQTWNKTESLSF